MTATSPSTGTYRQTLTPFGGRRATIVAVASALAGALLAFLWSFELVDHVIGNNVANSVLGEDATQTALVGSLTGAVFAFVSGLAGTFTACNIAVFAALPEIGEQTAGRRQRFLAVLRPMAWMAFGLVAVAAVYGFVAVLIGPGLPQLSTGTVGAGMPVRLLQASVVFGVIGLAFTYLGLAALGLLPDPFRHRPRARLFLLGALVGGFLIGRPYPLFRKLLAHAVEADDPLYGAATMVLQSLGNVVVMLLIAVVLVLATGGRFTRWVSRPGRAATLAGAALVLLGIFLVVYWDLRLPARFGYGWFPTAPWNS
ncbi:hypothetical protein GCM10027290_63550 [Micromonospora sonneratiae]|uniref:Cytochrome C biogenesis protein transmembrane region n=1 Tax=Micromonospora sonneratiae TaxID=1184706 RepID=A0ABW3YMZ8_9ACTN